METGNNTGVKTLVPPPPQALQGKSPESLVSSPSSAMIQQRALCCVPRLGRHCLPPPPPLCILAVRPYKALPVQPCNPAVTHSASPVRPQPATYMLSVVASHS